MQLIKTLLIAAVLAAVSVNGAVMGGNQQQQVDDSSSASDSKDDTPAPTEKGYNLKEISFQSGDIVDEEKHEEKESNKTMPVVAAVGACAVVGVLAAVYVKRRSEEEKLPGEIFTIDDKNSVL